MANNGPLNNDKTTYDSYLKKFQPILKAIKEDDVSSANVLIVNLTPTEKILFRLYMEDIKNSHNYMQNLAQELEQEQVKIDRLEDEIKKRELLLAQQPSYTNSTTLQKREIKHTDNHNIKIKKCCTIL